MNVKNIALRSALLALCASGLAFAEEDQSSDHYNGNRHHRGPVGLVKTVQNWASQYKDIDTAIGDGYVQASGCVSAPGGGAMGIHFVRFDLIGDGVVDSTTPELLVYEPSRSGRLRLVAVEFITIKEAWEAMNGVDIPAILDGQHMMLTGAPNRYALPAHYMLHVWAFRNNPSGVFAANNPEVTCENYQPAAG